MGDSTWIDSVATRANRGKLHRECATSTVIRRGGVIDSAETFNEPGRTIFIYTRRKVYKKDLKILPTSINTCGISYTQGHVDDLGEEPNQTQGAAYTVIQTQGQHRYTCGSSISPGNEDSAGTFGAVVSKSGQLFGLTNNHVTGGCNHSGIGLPILAPGVRDVIPNGIHPFTIGLHSALIPYNIGRVGNIDVSKNIDAAIFELVAPANTSSMQGTVYDTPTSILDPTEGMRVEKVGRTTGHTIGTIMGRELTPIAINASSAKHGFSGTILFCNVWTVHGQADAFSLAGDSGSLVVNVDAQGNRHAVGLVFAGGQDSSAPGNMRSFILPIQPMLDELGVTLVGGHNVP